jgi:hypothetical protein
MSVFLDTNIVVYLIERTPDFWPTVAARIQSLLSQGERLVVSDLVRENSNSKLETGTQLHWRACHWLGQSSDGDFRKVTRLVDVELGEQPRKGNASAFDVPCLTSTRNRMEGQPARLHRRNERHAIAPRPCHCRPAVPVSTRRSTG